MLSIPFAFPMDSSTFPLIRVKKIARRASRAGSAELGLFEPLCWSRLAWPLRFEDSPGFLCDGDSALGHGDLALGHRDPALGHGDPALGHGDLALGHRDPSAKSP